MSLEIKIESREQYNKIAHEEGRHFEFSNIKSKYLCLINRSNVTGAWCGYVYLPEDHPFYNLDYDDIDIDIDVHGGLTFSQYGIFGFDCSHAWDYYPLMDFESIGFPNALGSFVTSMADLYENMQASKDKILSETTYKTKEYAIKETENMAEQFYQYRE